MGTIYTLSGPSGVGKTSLLLEARERLASSRIQLIPRYTDRPRRRDEIEGLEYYFTSHQGMLQKLFANDFIHIEKWGDYHSAIEWRLIENTLAADADGLVLASTFGAARLRATYASAIVPIYLWVGDHASLLNPRCLDNESEESLELKWRIRKKLVEDGFSEYETASLTNDEFLLKRLSENHLDLAATNGRLRAGEKIHVVCNPHNALDGACENLFRTLRDNKSPIQNQTMSTSKGCFVLMPFGAEFDPVYDDYILPTMSRIGVSVTRADRIRSTNPIIEDINEAIASCSWIIADLTNSNPNVFYEVGMCHALGKKVVLLTRDSAAVPFDLKHVRHIRYEYTPHGMKKLEREIAETVEALRLQGPS